MLFKGLLKERQNPGPKSVALMGFKPDLFVTVTMSTTLTQATCCMSAGAA